MASSTHFDSSSNAFVLVTTSFFPRLLSTMTRSGGSVRANPVVSRGSSRGGAGFTGGMYTFSLLRASFSSLLVYFVFFGGFGAGTGDDGWLEVDPVTAAALRAFFFRVPDVADDFCPFAIVCVCDGGRRCLE